MNRLPPAAQLYDMFRKPGAIHIATPHMANCQGNTVSAHEKNTQLGAFFFRSVKVI